MAGLVDKLTASGGTESAGETADLLHWAACPRSARQSRTTADICAGFLNDIVAQLWPNINVAGCRMVKEIVEPILASTLPGPLSSLRFVKLDLGQEPVRISEVDVHKTQNGGIKLDMNIVWDGKSDIDLEGSLVPKLVKLRAACHIGLYPHRSLTLLTGCDRASDTFTCRVGSQFCSRL